MSDDTDKKEIPGPDPFEGFDWGQADLECGVVFSARGKRYHAGAFPVVATEDTTRGNLLCPSYFTPVEPVRYSLEGGRWVQDGTDPNAPTASELVAEAFAKFERGEDVPLIPFPEQKVALMEPKNDDTTPIRPGTWPAGRRMQQLVRLAQYAATEEELTRLTRVGFEILLETYREGRSDERSDVLQYMIAVDETTAEMDIDTYEEVYRDIHAGEHVTDDSVDEDDETPITDE